MLHDNELVYTSEGRKSCKDNWMTFHQPMYYIVHMCIKLWILSRKVVKKVTVALSVFISREFGTDCRELLRGGGSIFCMRDINSFPKKVIIESSMGAGSQCGSVHAVILWFRVGASPWENWASRTPKRENKCEQTRQH
jgi:hypothetical protein